jgi:hypothetical protein
MAFIRNCFVIAVLFFCVLSTKAQTVYYPVQSSQLLKATAEDLAVLLHKAMPGNTFTIKEYTTIPATGIILIYDSAITDNQSCRVESDGSSFARFSASQDNGLHFGIYQYLNQSGFRFYQPGSIWEVIPSLSSPYKKITTTYTCNYKYKSWSISGGCNRWIMDDNGDYGWDSYFGENGHNWALYQRRNGMTGGYHFSGHRGDIMNGDYLTALQNNPCYVACYDGSRIAGTQSVPDINNNNSVQLWGSTIEQKYTQFKNIIFSNPALYANYYRNFNYYNGQIGIEVPDGAKWGNSKDNGICSNIDYPKESDQQFILANHTAEKLTAIYPRKQLQLYAYSTHADVPSPSITINTAIDVQVVPTAFQNESSAIGLLNRWYNKTHSVSEYHYLNIPQWGGETPMFYLAEMKNTLQRIKEKNSEGIMWEASPAKFASLPFLLAANNNLKDGIPVDSTLHQFCNDMFAAASNSIYGLLQWWSDDKSISTGSFIQDNKYKIPLYTKLINDAVQQTKNAAPVVQERIRELKAYLHYMVLYYDWLFDQHANNYKTTKAAALCLYLAKINKLQLVNSYYLILNITKGYATTDNFYLQYNVNNGTAYQNGQLPLITDAEIDNNFVQDMGLYGSLVQDYRLETAAYVKDQFVKNNLAPLKNIEVKISYTNGANYPNRCEFFIDAPAAGNFSIQYTPHFNMAGKGYINFTVEAADKAMQVVKDLSIGNSSGAGTFSVALPSAGTYKLSVVSKYQSAVDLLITTNGNYFYKNGPFLGNKTENYRGNLSSLPGYFYVPGGISKIFFSINNSSASGSHYATADQISKAFVIKDNWGSTLLPRLVTPNDSALFYLEVPVGGSGAFWQAQQMEQYNLCFANISNHQWYAMSSSGCTNADFTIAVIKNNGNCITRLTATAKSNDLQWQVDDLGKTIGITGQSVLDLPDYSSPDAVITLTTGGICSATKRLGNDQKWVRAMADCASGATLPLSSSAPLVYPNPSNGIYNCEQNGEWLTANEIIVTNVQGVRVGYFKNVRQFNISNTAAGVYWYRMLVNGVEYKGKLMKL